MVSKAEKREQRRALKLEKDLKKAARQFADPATARHVVEGAQIALEKKVAEPALTPHERLMVLDRAHEDAADAWSWGRERCCILDFWQQVVGPYVAEYQTKRWGEIDAEMTGKRHRRRKKHVYYPFEKLIGEAHDRLIELELDDFAPNMFRFRLSGKHRLFGFRIDATATFFTVWFDPDHKIYAKD